MLADINAILGPSLIILNIIVMSLYFMFKMKSGLDINKYYFWMNRFLTCLT